MAVVDYANFIVECLTSDGFPVRDDGWLLKHVDTGQQYIRVSGEWKSLALGLSFAPPTKSGSVVTDADGVAEIVFGTPFIDDAYTIVMTCGNTYPSPVVQTTGQTANGFSMQSRYARTGEALGSVPVAWLATRNYNA